MSRTAWIVLGVVVVLVVGVWLLTPSPETPVTEQPPTTEPAAPPPPPPPPPPAPPDAKDVTLTYVGDGEGCVTTDPPDVEIFKDKANNNDKVKKVRWVVSTADQDKYQWKIAYADAKAAPGQTAKDLLSPVDPILCGDDKTKSDKAKDDGTADDVVWPYEVSVFECQAQGEPVHLCDSDPIIWIKDQ